MDIAFFQSLSYIVAIMVFVWYLRKDSKDDYIRLETKLELWRAESREDNRRIEGLVSAIKEDVRDFHTRLCKIEEKRKN